MILKKKTTGHLRLCRLLLCAGLLFSFTFNQFAYAGESERRQAKRIHDRLTGVPATNDVIDNMENILLGNPVVGFSGPLNDKGAAQYAIDLSLNPNASSFYNVTVKNFATPWTNEEQDVFVPLNDYSATVIGMVRDGEDFRQLLHGDIIYTDSTPANYTPNSNAYYEAMESQDLSAILQKQTQSTVTGLPSPATAGVMTTRAAAKAFFVDGTNRAMFRFTLMNHLCTDLEPLKDIARTPDRVRQDVSRSPGGDSRIYLNNCVGCHAGMDGMAGAFAYYQYDYTNDKESGRLIYTDGVVQEKHLINSNNFKPGYVTIDDSWINYWRNGQNALLGWGNAAEVLDTKGNATGNGAKALGIELANTQAFARCQVDKVFKTVCLRDPNDYASDRDERDTNMIPPFISSGYDMRQVFSDTAAWCRGS
jgi:hypothetical protein